MQNEIKTIITADNRKFIQAQMEAKAKVKELAQAIKSEYGTSLKEAESLARKTLSTTEKGFDSVQKSVSKASVGLNLFKSALLSIASVATFKNIFNDVDKLSATADKLNMPVEEMQMFQYAAMRADTDIGTLDNGLKKLRSTLADAAGGSKEARAAFLNLGLDYKSLNSMSAGDATKEISKSLEGMSSESQVGAVNGIYGKKGGQEQLNLLRTIAESEREYKQMDIGLTKEQIKVHAQLDKEMNKASAQIGNGLKNAYIELAPAIRTATAALNDWIATGFGAFTMGHALADLAEYISPNTYDPNDTTGAAPMPINQRRDLIASAKSTQGGGDTGAGVGQILIAELQALVPAVVMARDTFTSITDTLDKAGSVAGNLVSAHSTLEEAMGRLSITAGATGSALESIGKSGLADALGLGKKNEGKNYLSSILKPIEQVKDDNFTRIANQIRDNIADKGDDADPQWIRSRISELESISKMYERGGGFGKEDQSNSGMVAAVRELRQASDNINKDQTVTVIVKVDNNSFISAVVESKQFQQAGAQAAARGADEAARQAVR